MFQNRFLLPTLLFFLASCAGPNQAIDLTLDPSLSLPTNGITQSKSDLLITLFPVEHDNPERKKFYKDFTNKGFLPLQISIQNPSEKTFSFERVQYAICDPNFKRTRRISPKNMALMNAQIIYEKKPSKVPFLNGIKKLFAASKMTEQYQNYELQTSLIPSASTINGWLYFQVKEGEFDPHQFFDELSGYQLEIAHVKDLTTNIINNFYFPLDELTSKQK